MISRFHFPGRLPGDGEVALPDDLAHHALRVLRLRDGAPMVLFDGEGGEVEARLAVRGKAGFALLGERHACDRESPVRVVLAQALAAGDKMDWVVQKAVELGVAAIHPVQAERSVLRLSGERADKRRAHWQQVAVSACEQSGRNRIPEVASVRPLAQWLDAMRGQCAYVLAPGGGAGFPARERPEGAVHVLVGPEGGWTESELAACDAAGLQRVTLGPRVLRTETAGLAALAVLQAHWGDF
ncbi:16S rRNA (uracil(1498)-N(3))-methyltransferase [Thauera linaloolentis]|uniref:Ribosomal RNA small subunit methyltransferase E n=1 Tax=Thauera linaloolentis (strain DSM 12138 / JCM 21573 / CCUG 41526 / CIP 105981 / IAM 15112 / NBRC 102519 / 47Lol) TaxID=1123367 RepID=N6Z7Y0_THAL4|nr:16S rRNA (uracil(1498)-N(3))-methyltransferase [Thauera linaloolentis]ENO90403.1 16S ribosomal RNA methyltransferase RsmE [Thauera linaloolentis 47Lol = DSM 12138]MCM8564023.1 16S rRNA (uracil(1498)-N(3))-methyltransferase [Thauera linaloolentis]